MPHTFPATIIIPCYNVESHIEDVVRMFSHIRGEIVLVNDASTDRTKEILERLRSPKIHALHLETNLGVGGAYLTGVDFALARGAKILVKADGDGQMDPFYLPSLINPLITGKADFTKGNRFSSITHLRQMPKLRMVGNAGLSFLTRLASGYWNVFDPTNGYFAARSEVYDSLTRNLFHRRYFFESSQLMALGLIGAVVQDIPMPSRYGKERSHLRVSRTLFEFPFYLFLGFLRRLWLRKILHTLTPEAILGIVGMIFILGGSSFGINELIHFVFVTQTPAPPGTVMTAALPILLGFQMIMSALLIDISSVPRIPLSDPLLLDKDIN